MTDRELLEAAAKAAGITLPHYVAYGVDDWMREWNPIDDDGDALRLAVKLDLLIAPAYGATAAGKESTYGKDVVEIHRGDPYAATRRAIVRAAAALGESKT